MPHKGDASFRWIFDLWLPMFPSYKTSNKTYPVLSVAAKTGNKQYEEIGQIMSCGYGIDAK